MRSKYLYSKLNFTYFLLIILLNFAGCNKSEPENENAKKEQSWSQQSTLVAHSKKWTCPMHPQVIRSEPGHCPICGMELVEIKDTDNIKADGAEQPEAKDDTADNADNTAATDVGEDQRDLNRVQQHGQVVLSSQKAALLGLRLGVVQKKMLTKFIDVPGRVAFDPELYNAESEYLEALAQRNMLKSAPLADVQHSADRMLSSARLRLKILGLSDAQIKALGQRAEPGAALLLPTQGGISWVYAEVFEMDLPHIRPDLTVEITGRVLGEDKLQGRVVSVDRVINPSTRTAKVRIQIANTRLTLRPESFVNVRFSIPLGVSVVVPFDAVFDTGREAWTFVRHRKKSTGKSTDSTTEMNQGYELEARRVVIGERAGDELGIAKGLEPGEEIVTSANFLIDSESRFRAGTGSGGL